MSTLFCQTLPNASPEAGAIVIICLQVIMCLLLFWKSMTRKDPPPAPALPQPVITKRDTDYVPRHEFTRLEGEVKHLDERLHNMHKDLTDQGQKRADGIHERLNLLISQHSEIRGRLESLTSHHKSAK